MHFNITIRSVSESSASAKGLYDAYETIDAHDLLRELALHDSEKLDDETLFALYSYLTSGRAPEGSLQLSQLDGFLTAVTASRDGVPVLDWMPVVWGGGEPEFEDMAEAKLVLSAIARRCRQIDMQLQCTGELICLLKRDPGGDVLAGDWCRGFIRGLLLTPEQWKGAFDHGLGQQVLLPIATVANDERALALFGSVDGTDWKCAPDVLLAYGHPFLTASELPDIWADLRAARQHAEVEERA